MEELQHSEIKRKLMSKFWQNRETEREERNKSPKEAKKKKQQELSKTKRERLTEK